MALTPRAPQVVYCDQCGTPVLEVHENCLVIQCRHHGEDHVTVVELAVVIKEAFAAVAHTSEGSGSV